jgi:hypothetical protein
VARQALGEWDAEPNRTPTRDRAVAVSTLDAPFSERVVGDWLLGRPAYRRTRYIVARGNPEIAVVEVTKRAEQELFSEITSVSVLASPEETAFVHAPEADTTVPSQLARVAAAQAPGFRCVVIEGRYEHINFILDPAPLPVHVVEVVPPWPAKLVDQAERMLAVAEDLPPIELVPELIDVADLAREAPAAHYLLPCRGGGGSIAGAQVSYLDEIPERAEWTLLGSARSRAIHRYFYGYDAPSVELCPRHRDRCAAPAGAAVLTKCCQLEAGIERDGCTVIVPWGASLAEVCQGLAAAAEAAGAQPAGAGAP